MFFRIGMRASAVFFRNVNFFFLQERRGDRRVLRRRWKGKKAKSCTIEF